MTKVSTLWRGPLDRQDSSSINQSSKVNMKSTICHDFLSPDLLESQKLTETDPRIKVAHIGLYHTLTLIFSQPQEVANKYF